MKYCLVKGCGQRVSLVRYEGAEDGVCFYHHKIRHGLMLPSLEGMRWKLGLRANRQVEIRVGGIRPGAVLTDEMLELGALLRALGYPSKLVGRLMTRGVR